MTTLTDNVFFWMSAKERREQHSSFQRFEQSWAFDQYGLIAAGLRQIFKPYVHANLQHFRLVQRDDDSSIVFAEFPTSAH